MLTWVVRLAPTPVWARKKGHSRSDFAAAKPWGASTKMYMSEWGWSKLLVRIPVPRGGEMCKDVPVGSLQSLRGSVCRLRRRVMEVVGAGEGGVEIVARIVLEGVADVGRRSWTNWPGWVWKTGAWRRRVSSMWSDEGQTGILEWRVAGRVVRSGRGGVGVEVVMYSRGALEGVRRKGKGKMVSRSEEVGGVGCDGGGAAEMGEGVGRSGVVRVGRGSGRVAGERSGVGERKAISQGVGVCR